ncbi:AraC family transcriptional regulator [Roseivirga misakiensis]|uniref:AraC family transcriptional regulator n=1 Tax=Roseivirga misakiensis TaxID=1563681 RepID=A0A1E5T761_9BACT|nr:AraC family transcriptional regulator [Roseivirga misakiensis]OEK07224.1 AraC family transcriptional regulator [Roseivirga misakiensis]
MVNTKPSLEQILPAFGSSFLVRRYSSSCEHNLANWHFHPELELVYVHGGSGKRHIGKHMSYFNDGELVLIGSFLPHYGFTDRFSGNKSETVIQFKQDFLGNDFFGIPEMESVKRLLELAKKGLTFHGSTKDKVGAKIEALAWEDQYGRLIGLLSILKDLSDSQEYEVLNAEGVALAVDAKENDRMNVIYSHIRSNFKEHISLEEMADKVSMTVPAFCRYFKKISRKTFTKFVNEYRVVHASKLLAETSMAITEVSFESGFNNFSHFNKSFKLFTGKSPSEYRKDFKHIILEK